MNNITITALFLGIAALSILMFKLIKNRNNKKCKGRSQNYKGLFIIGISWIPLGIVMENYAFMAIGIVFMIIGLKNKDKWKNEPKWSELSSYERRFSIKIIAGVLVLAIIAILVVFLTK